VSVVLLGRCESVERHSFQLEVPLFQHARADDITCPHSERDHWHHSSVATMAWNT